MKYICLNNHNDYCKTIKSNDGNCCHSIPHERNMTCELICSDDNGKILCKSGCINIKQNRKLKLQKINEL